MSERLKELLSFLPTAVVVVVVGLFMVLIATGLLLFMAAVWQQSDGSLQGLVDWFKNVQDGQGALVGAAMGLGALAAATLLNAYFQRRRDDRVREIERRSLASALAAEITRIAGDARGKRAAMEQFYEEMATAAVSDALRFEPPLIFESNAGRLGLLTPETTKEVVDLYGAFATVRRLGSENSSKAYLQSALQSLADDGDALIRHLHVVAKMPTPNEPEIQPSEAET
jgi:hypothetical protein